MTLRRRRVETPVLGREKLWMFGGVNFWQMHACYNLDGETWWAVNGTMTVTVKYFTVYWTTAIGLVSASLSPFSFKTYLRRSNPFAIHDIDFFDLRSVLLFCGGKMKALPEKRGSMIFSLFLLCWRRDKLENHLWFWNCKSSIISIYFSVWHAFQQLLV